MKYFWCVGLLFLLVTSCKKTIKNEVQFAEIQGFEEIKFVEPTVTNRFIVASELDLLGYWVGNFEANIEQNEEDSIYESDANAPSIFFRKITFSIDQIKGDSILGHSVVAGNISPFKGVLINQSNSFRLEVEEFKKTNSDGTFTLQVVKNDSVLVGDWEAYFPDKVKIPSRVFQLKKKFFVYDKNVELKMTYINSEKFTNVTYTDTIDDEVEVYEDVEYYATTNQLFLYNSSTQLLTSEYVANLTKADIFILRNSIFARHGFAFRDRQLRLYFESYSWYMPVFGDVKSKLTEVEIKNIDLLLRYEQNALEYYDTFGR